MHTEFIINQLSCEIAQLVYNKYQVEAYGLRACELEYSHDALLNKQMLLGVFKHFDTTQCITCNIDDLKELV